MQKWKAVPLLRALLTVGFVVEDINVSFFFVLFWVMRCMLEGCLEVAVRQDAVICKCRCSSSVNDLLFEEAASSVLESRSHIF